MHLSTTCPKRNFSDMQKMLPAAELLAYLKINIEVQIIIVHHANDFGTRLSSFVS